MGKKEGKDMVECNFFKNGFMNISMERLEIPFHVCKNITLKCQHLYNFPLFSTSFPQIAQLKTHRSKSFILQNILDVWKICIYL